MSLRRIVDTFEELRHQQVPVVLATVYATEGSTYSKAGQRILLGGNGEHYGLVSGGCLESDLAAHASQVLTAGAPRTMEYDLRDDDDELFGLGLGCRGLLRILLQPLEPARSHEPFATMCAWLRAGRDATISVVIESESGTPAVGTTVLDSAPQCIAPGIDARQAEMILEALGDPSREPGLHELQLPTGRCTVLHQPLPHIPRLLVLGAGPDVVPLLRLAAETGWHSTAVDHREAYIESAALEVADRRVCIQPDRLAREIPLGRFDAAVVMSHHLPSDLAYLQALAETAVPYVGLLGPAERRDRLLARLEPAEREQLKPRLHGPAGLPIHAHSPETIALSILAEIESLRASAPTRFGSAVQ